jgi:hypothetical protein
VPLEIPTLRVEPSPTFAALAPRLARAHAGRVAELEWAGRRLTRTRNRIHHVHGVVEHRELMVLRAGARGSRSYFAYRSKKLDLINKELAALVDLERDLVVFLQTGC